MYKIILFLCAVGSILFWGISQLSAASYESAFGNDYVKSNTPYYQQGLSWAELYVQTHIDDDYWAWKKPKLENYGVLYFTDDLTTPAYIEYKIVCNNSDCGAVTVNIDGNDVLIPEGSTYWKANFEILSESYPWKKVGKKQLYRIWLLEQYIVDQDGLASLDKWDTTTAVELWARIKKFKEFKNTQDFVKAKNQFRWKTQESTVEAVAPSGTITFPIGGSTNVFIPGSSTFDCPSRTPCYNQFQTTYNGISCWNGCAPTAAAIIMGYHDRNTKPNLMLNTVAPVLNTSAANTMALSIATSMQTTCTTSQQWSTIVSNVASGINYAKTN